MPFNFIVMFIYLVDTILFQAIQGPAVYNAMDWFVEPGKATGVFIATMVGMVVIFSLMTLLTNKVKLPNYRGEQEARATALLYSDLVQDKNKMTTVTSEDDSESHDMSGRVN